MNLLSRFHNLHQESMILQVIFNQIDNHPISSKIKDQLSTGYPMYYPVKGIRMVKILQEVKCRAKIHPFKSNNNKKVQDRITLE